MATANGHLASRQPKQIPVAPPLKQELGALLQQSVSPNVEDIKAAEVHLKELQERPEFIPASLSIIQDQTVNTVLRQAGSILLKNHIKRLWDCDPTHGGVSSDHRELVKDTLVDLLLLTPEVVRSQLSEILHTIALADFPEEWKSLVRDVVERHLASPDPERRCVALEVLETVTSRYRQLGGTSGSLDGAKAELKFHVLPYICEPMLAVFQWSIQQMVATPSMITAQRRVMGRIVELCCQILYSLHLVDLPEFFEDHQKDFFAGLLQSLSFNFPDISAGDDDDSPGDLQEHIKTEACRVMTIYAQRYAEEYEPYVGPCVATVIQLLRATSMKSSQDGVVNAAIRYLSAACRCRWANNPFDNVDVLRELCTSVVIPNIQLRESDLELMEDNPQEYIRRDIEKYDAETRRGAAMEFVKALGQLHEEEMTQILSGFIEELLAETARADAAKDDSKSQRMRDATVYLVIAIAVKAETRLRGVGQVNQRVNVIEFFTNHLSQELVGEEVDSRPLARAAALKFVITFRNQLSREMHLQLLPVVVKHINARNPVVHTYAAACIERCLAARDIVQESSVGSTATLGELKINPHAAQALLLQALAALQQAVLSGRGIEQNEYLVKAELRLFTSLQEDAKSVCIEYLKGIIAVMTKTAASPINALFNHYLFENIATLVRIGSKLGKHSEIEGVVLPALVPLIQQENHDFVPYCFQILGLLLDMTSHASPHYVEIFEYLLAVERWTTSAANVPGIIRLYSSYFRKAAIFKDLLMPRMKTILERFQYCLLHRKLAAVAFDLLDDIFEYLPFDYFKDYFKTLVTVLLSRLQSHKTTKLCHDVVIAFSIVTTRAETLVLPQTLESIQPGLTTMVVSKIIVPQFEDITKIFEKKLLLLASARLSTYPQVMNNPEVLSQVFKGMLNLFGLTTIERSQRLEDGDEDAIEIIQQNEEFQGSFNKLVSAKTVTRDRASHIGDLRSAMTACLMSDVMRGAASTVPGYGEVCGRVAVLPSK